LDFQRYIWSPTLEDRAGDIYLFEIEFQHKENLSLLPILDILHSNKIIATEFEISAKITTDWEPDRRYDSGIHIRTMIRIRVK